MLESGGWLYKRCGHFYPSTFIQIAEVQGECSNCKYAREILEQSKLLTTVGMSAPPKWSVVAKYREADQIPKKRIPDCKMNY